MRAPAGQPVRVFMRTECKHEAELLLSAHKLRVSECGRALERQRETEQRAGVLSSSLAVGRGVSTDQYKVQGEPLGLSQSSAGGGSCDCCLTLLLARFAFGHLLTRSQRSEEGKRGSPQGADPWCLLHLNRTSFLTPSGPEKAPVSLHQRRQEHKAGENISLSCTKCSSKNGRKHRT